MQSVRLRMVMIVSLGGFGCNAGGPMDHPRVPVITGIVPNWGVAGASVEVELQGRNFVDGGTAVTVEPGEGMSGSHQIGVKVEEVRLITSSLLRAQLLIDENAARGERQLAVKTAAGSSASWHFEVTGPRWDGELVTGSYMLDRLAGWELPVTVTICTQYTYLEGQFEIRPDNTATRTQRRITRFGVEEMPVFHGVYERHGDQLRIDFRSTGGGVMRVDYSPGVLLERGFGSECDGAYTLRYRLE